MASSRILGSNLDWSLAITSVNDKKVSLSGTWCANSSRTVGIGGASGDPDR